MYDLVKDYYGKQLKGTADLRTSACCDASQMPDWFGVLLKRTAAPLGASMLAQPPLTRQISA